MKRIAKLLSAFKRDDSGATAIEYGMLLTGIVLIIFVAVEAVGPPLIQIFEDIHAGF